MRGLAWVAQRGGGCHITGSIPGQGDGALSNLVSLKVSLIIPVGLG